MKFNLPQCHCHFLSLTTIFLLLFNNYIVVESHMSDDWAEVYNTDELLCEISQLGLYGVESNHTKPFKYNYTMEYEKWSGISRDMDVGDTENTEHNIESIVKGVETVIITSILKSTSLFEVCQFDEERRGRKMTQLRSMMPHGRKLSQDVIGITTKPDDKYSVIDCASDAVSTESTCLSIQGEFMLYLEDSSSQLQNGEVEEIRSVIQDLLSADGMLVTETSSILRMEYIDENGSYGSSPDQKNGWNTAQKASISIGSITGVALCGLLGYGGYKWRQRRQRDAGIAEYNEHAANQARIY